MCGEEDVMPFYLLFWGPFLFGPFTLGAVERKIFWTGIFEGVELPRKYLEPPVAILLPDRVVWIPILSTHRIGDE